MLQQLVRKLDIGAHVIFQNRFVELKELCEFLGIADIYVTPYLEEAQIASGALAYAMGTGKAVIFNPVLVCHRDACRRPGPNRALPQSGCLAEQIIDLLNDDVERRAMRKKAYTFSREAVWEAVSRKYLQVFSEVRQNRTGTPVPGIPMSKTSRPSRILSSRRSNSIDLKHIDDTGMLQHANMIPSDRTHGYCTDDNARVLLVATMGRRLAETTAGPLFPQRSLSRISSVCLQ